MWSLRRVIFVAFPSQCRGPHLATPDMRTPRSTCCRRARRTTSNMMLQLPSSRAERRSPELRPPSSSTTAREALDVHRWHMPRALSICGLNAAEPRATDSRSVPRGGRLCSCVSRTLGRGAVQRHGLPQRRPCVEKPSRTSSMRARSTVSYLRAASWRSSSSAALSWRGDRGTFLAWWRAALRALPRPAYRCRGLRCPCCSLVIAARSTGRGPK